MKKLFYFIIIVKTYYLRTIEFETKISFHREISGKINNLFIEKIEIIPLKESNLKLTPKIQKKVINQDNYYIYNKSLYINYDTNFNVK